MLPKTLFAVASYHVGNPAALNRDHVQRMLCGIVFLSLLPGCLGELGGSLVHRSSGPLVH